MSSNDRNVDRRGFLTGRFHSEAQGRESGPARSLHISSAVVTARPERCPDIARQIAMLPATEISGIEGSKIVIVMEGRNTGEIGSRLTAIALMDGVFSANLVFEQIEPVDDWGAE
ncbi:chaperone NapD [Chelatococcus reniformis]|uniref:Chaperone NapD n=1 Tax=Chelatococcus reniformis TaxID=1494448 RepID=A0A916TX54_9HYPH|nr:chaperone NapD [Chelatococcus reniformis]GGC48961.1 glutamate synthase subunit beta [Chelatococcus reniformis]